MRNHLSRCAINLILIVFTLSFLAACAAKNITRETQLDDNEGILITRVHSNMVLLNVAIHRKDTIGYPVVSLLDRHSLEFLRVVKIPAGEFYFSRVSQGYLYIDLDKRYFTVEPGKITYAGDVFIEWGEYDYFWGKGSASVQLLDKESETIAVAKEKYPWIFDRFPYKKSIPE